jgi:hypothetical protein
MARTQPGNRIGHGAYYEFYKAHYPNKKNTEYTDFIKSNYYSAFVKFGNYCCNLNIQSAVPYVRWLLENKVGIDSWCVDSNYGKFLIQWLRLQHYQDAITRTYAVLEIIGKELNLLPQDVLRYANVNTILARIVAGEITPWILWKTEVGQEFLTRLDEKQAEYVLEYIAPEQWQIKFKRDPETAEAAIKLMNELGVK